MKEFTILVSDRNGNVREYLRRELAAEGYRVRLAKSGQEVLKWIYYKEPIDLVILDPELPDADEIPLLERINDRVPTLPVIVHAFSPDYSNRPDILRAVKFVEKRGSSIEHLKEVVFELLTGINS